MTIIKKHRIFGIDIIRIVCALLIYMRHSITMYGCSYGSSLADTSIVALTSPVMSMFFILSGFSINYSSAGTSEWDYRATCFFYAKRLVQILPAYLLIHCLWLFLGNDSFRRWLFLTPFELSALQSMYSNTFSLLHNGGTWFISCLLISYLVYPVLRTLFFNLSRKSYYALTAITIAFLIYLPLVGSFYDLGSVYSNPVFRCLEFMLGVLISNSALSIDQHYRNDSSGPVICLIGFVLAAAGTLVFIHYLADPLTIGSKTHYVSLSQLIMYPYCLLLLCISAITRNEVLESSRVLRYLSGLIYYFFILQLILWKVSDAVIGKLSVLSGFDFSSNISRITLSFFLCLILSIAVRELYDRPVKAICYKKIGIFNDPGIR